MTFMQADVAEFEEVRQHHDAFVEQGRLELMAEEQRAQGNAGQLDSTERNVREFGLVLQA